MDAADYERMARLLHPSAGPLKEAARRAGCRPPFFDFLDSYADQFAALVGWAKNSCPSLVRVAEVPRDGLGVRADWSALGVPAGCRLLAFTDPDPGDHVSYAAPADGIVTHMEGVTYAFADAAGRLRTLILIQADPAPGVSSLAFAVDRVIALLHEAGHVRDHEDGRHFDPAAGTVGWVAAEASAHRYALAECDRRAFFFAAGLYRAMLARWQSTGGMWGRIAAAALAETPPAVRPWHEVVSTEVLEAALRHGAMVEARE